MKNPAFYRIFSGILVSIILAGCSSALKPPFQRGSSENITFIISISPGMFSSEAVLQVRVFNEEQMKISDQNAHCTVSFDAQTGVEKMQCPTGVEFHEVQPEIFEFPVPVLESRIELVSKTLRKGEEFMLQISGLSNDDCNTTSASLRGKVRTSIIKISDLAWATTLMACP